MEFEHLGFDIFECIFKHLDLEQLLCLRATNNNIKYIVDVYMKSNVSINNVYTCHRSFTYVKPKYYSNLSNNIITVKYIYGLIDKINKIYNKQYDKIIIETFELHERNINIVDVLENKSIIIKNLISDPFYSLIAPKVINIKHINLIKGINSDIFNLNNHWFENKNALIYTIKNNINFKFMVNIEIDNCNFDINVELFNFLPVLKYLTLYIRKIIYGSNNNICELVLYKSADNVFVDFNNLSFSKLTQLDITIDNIYNLQFIPQTVKILKISRADKITGLNSLPPLDYLLLDNINYKYYKNNHPINTNRINNLYIKMCHVNVFRNIFNNVFKVTLSYTHSDIDKNMIIDKCFLNAYSLTIYANKKIKCIINNSYAKTIKSIIHHENISLILLE